MGTIFHQLRKGYGKCLAVLLTVVLLFANGIPVFADSGQDISQSIVVSAVNVTVDGNDVSGGEHSCR